MKKENVLIVSLICIAVIAAVIYKNTRSDSLLSSSADQATSESAAKDSINWQDFKPGFRLAGEQNKPIFLYFYADWCTYCTKLKKTTFKDKKVLDFLDKEFISIRVNTDIEKELADNWKVRGLPTSWFLEKDGTRISSIPGYMDEKQFLTILKYIQTGSYKDLTLHEFIKTL